ncbi:MAG: lytic transglycosylase domain-containing protein [Acidobacteriota bacterium]|nr:lytic transglycosylase domain-containing protein [Acidobacteriota bacterium]
MALNFKSTFVAVFIALVASSSSAADLAILRNGFTIRHERREARESVTRLYFLQTAGGYVDVPSEEILRFERQASETPAPAQAPEIVAPAPVLTLNDVVSVASTKNKIDPTLVMCVIRAESAFDANAISPKGAQGLMQLMPQTAASLGVQNPLDPVANIEGGTRYLRQLLDRYGNNLIKALAAYNAGPERVDAYRGVPPFAETRAYVAKIISDFNRQKRADYSNRSNELRTAKASTAASLSPDSPAAAE